MSCICKLTWLHILRCLLRCLLADASSLALVTEEQNAHSRSITSVAFSPDGKTIVSCSVDKSIKVWDSGTCDETTFPGALSAF